MTRKNRQELVVLMRPTVLRTPEISAQQTLKEEQKMPGVSAAAAAEAVEERKLIDAQRKRELRRAKSSTNYDGFYVTPPPAALLQPVPDAGTLDTAPVTPSAQPEVYHSATPAPWANPSAPAANTPAPAATPPAPAANPPVSVPAKAPIAPVPPAKPAPLGKDNGFFYDEKPTPASTNAPH